MDSTHWLYNATNGTDLGQIYWSPQCMGYVYDQSEMTAININSFEEVLDFMNQL